MRIITLLPIVIVSSLITGCALDRQVTRPLAGYSEPAPVASKEEIDRAITIGIYAGGAFPSYDAPQGPNLGAFSLGVKLREKFVLALDASFTGTSEKLDSGPLDRLSSFYGVSFVYYPKDWFFISAQPSAHHLKYTRQLRDGTDVSVANALTLKFGVGAGVHLGAFSLEGRAFPALKRTALPDGQASNTSQYHVRLGYNIEIGL